MTMDIVALAISAVISFIIPVIIFLCILAKGKGQRLSLFLLFLAGAVIYAAMQWGLKEHGLAWLFNHTDFDKFMDAHYIWYLLAVALAGSLLVLLPIWLLCMGMKKQVSFLQGIALGLGYTMTESILLIGIRSVNTIIEIVKGSEAEMNTGTAELFLTGYERILMSVIQIGIFVVLIYFIRERMAGRGLFLTVFCHMLAAFLPGFFIAFSLPDLLEVYDRKMALILVYVVLTAAAITSGVILYSLHDALTGKEKQ